MEEDCFGVTESWMYLMKTCMSLKLVGLEENKGIVWNPGGCQRLECYVIELQCV